MLNGYRHTHFDDVESFLYVLLLFFFSYAGPLPKEMLQAAHENGFVRSTGSGPLPHMRRWPPKFNDWADGDAQAVSDSKLLQIMSRNGLKWLDGDIEARDCLKNNWPEDLEVPIRTLLNDAFKVFRESLKGGTTPGERTEVSHAQFTKILDDWLEQHSELGRKYSQNHPPAELEETRLAEICLTCHIC